MMLFNNIPYKRMCLTSRVKLTKCFSEKYKCMRLITRLYGNYINLFKIAFVYLILEVLNFMGKIFHGIISQQVSS